jgi:hypothetical protein
MLIELCACNYCTNDGFVDGVEGFFKTTIESHLTSKIWVKFSNLKIEQCIRMINNILYERCKKYKLVMIRIICSHV